MIGRLLVARLGGTGAPHFCWVFPILHLSGRGFGALAWALVHLPGTDGQQEEVGHRFVSRESLRNHPDH